MRKRSGEQSTLFDVGATLPNGFVYRPEFLTKEEEAELLSYFEDLPLEHPVTEEYAAKLPDYELRLELRLRTRTHCEGSTFASLSRWHTAESREVARRTRDKSRRGARHGIHEWGSNRLAPR